jgi:hypothetical protein
MLQPSEVVGLAVALLLLPIIFTSSRTAWAPLRTLILASMLSIVAGNVFTIVEGFIWFDVFNVLEHASYAVAGIFALAALLTLRRLDPAPQGGAK